MESIEQREAELDDRIRRLRKARRLQLVYTIAAVSLGVGIGYAIAEAVIDPVVVVTSGCDGIRT